MNVNLNWRGKAVLLHAVPGGQPQSSGPVRVF